MATSVELQFERLLKNIALHAPGALSSTIKLVLFNALDEFFKTSNAWWEDEDILGIAGKTDYDILPTIGTIIRLVRAFDTNETTYIASLIPDTNVIRFETALSGGKTVTVRYTLTVTDPVKTTDGLCQFPSWVLDRYQDVITAGCIANLMMQPSKPYSNTNLGTYHMRRFRNGMANARVDAETGVVRDGQVWGFPSFA